MEEQLLFTRIHDALDVPTPPGAYERLRSELTKKPVHPFRWPALQTRWSKMSFRFAAGLAIIAIAAAAAAAAVAIHNSTNSTSPAGPRMSVQAYQKMINADSPNPNTIWTEQCDDTNPTVAGCQADAARSIPIIQKWLDDLKAASTPARFVVIDGELRQHLTQNLTALNQLETDARAGNRAAMAADFVIAVYAVDWTGTVVPLILASQQVTPAGYRNIVGVTKQHTFDLCAASCTLLASPQAKSCTTDGGIPCLEMFDEVASNYAAFAGYLVRDAAPDSLAAEDSKLQGDLASADAVLLQMRLAVGHGDQAAINSGISQLLRINPRIDQDAAKITG